MADLKEKPPGYVFGRPTKYREEFVTIAKDYYKSCKAKRQMPYLEWLCLEFEIDEETLTLWEEKYEDFSVPIKCIRDLQKMLLKQGGLSGQTNTTMSIFLLKANHGMIETEKRILEGSNDGKPINFTINAGNGFIPTSEQALTPPSGGSVVSPPEIQSPSVAQTGTQNDNSNNGVSETSST